MAVVFILYILTGLLLIGLAIPLMLGKIKPNHWYGFRIRLTLDNPDIWYPVNAWAGRWLLVIGLATIIATLAGLLLPKAALPGYTLLIALFLMVSISLLLVFGVRYARSLHQEQRDSTS